MAGRQRKRAVEEGMVINIELYSIAETGEQIGDEETICDRRGWPGPYLRSAASHSAGLTVPASPRT